MSKKAIIALAFLIPHTLFSAGAFAAPIQFITNISNAFGANAGLFTAGSTVTISYDLNNSVVDSNAATDAGLYFNATQSLKFDFSDLGLNIEFGGGTGNVSTFNNTANPDDQMFIFGGANLNGATLAGLEITLAELDFIGLTSMLSSDAMPTSLLSDLTKVNAFFLTADGYTQVDFSTEISAVPEPGILSLLLLGLFGNLVQLNSRRKKMARINS